MIARTVNLVAAAGLGYGLYKILRKPATRWLTTAEVLGSSYRTAPGQLTERIYDTKFKLTDDEILYWDPESGLFMKGGNI